MSAFIPHDATVALISVVGMLGELLVGFAITRIRSIVVARTAAWLLLVVGVVGIERLTNAQPAGFRLLANIGVLLFGMKAVVVVGAARSGKIVLSFWRWLGFAGLWFGMRPSVFADLPRPARDGASALFWMGVKRLLLGIVFVGVARALWILPVTMLSEMARRYAATLFLLPGLSLMLHFGLFNMLAGIWRFAGADCRPLFRAPLLSNSLTEFWGQRWNLAFSEMTALAVYRPLRVWLGTRAATAIAFLFSGLLHELAISVPVKAGFGLPLLYFALHAAAMSIEKRYEHTGRLWTIAWIMIPLPMLFHWPFLNGCVWPLIGMAAQ